MRRILSLLFIIGGILLLFYGSWQIYRVNKEQSEALQIAEQVVKSQTTTEQNTPVSATEEVTIDGQVVIGILDLPTLKEKLPIIEGTDEDQLDKGVGHYKGSAFPKEKNQIVLSGHRDTVFKRLGELQSGDVVTITTSNGEFDYKIKNTKIVDENDTTVIHSTFPNEELIISTCYPFGYVGNAPERYIIYAYPVEK